MQDVRYVKAATVDEAIALLGAGGPTARVLAGGTDVIVQARERRRDIDLFVDIKPIPETQAAQLRRRRRPHGRRRHALLPHLRRRDGRSASTPPSSRPTSVIGGIAIQGRASLGGNLCNSSPAADSIPAMIVLERRRQHRRARRPPQRPRRGVLHRPRPQRPRGRASSSSRSTSRRPPRRSGAAWERFIPRNEMDIAVVNAAVLPRASRATTSPKRARRHRRRRAHAPPRRSRRRRPRRPAPDATTSSPPPPPPRKPPPSPSTTCAAPSSSASTSPAYSRAHPARSRPPGARIGP